MLIWYLSDGINMRTQPIFLWSRAANAIKFNVDTCSSTKRWQAFSTSLMLQKLGPVPKMSGVKNPELQEILTRFRNNAILPKHLAKNQQDLVYKKKYASKLENEVVTAEISGEKFRLKHVDVLKDIPRLKLFVHDILPLLKDKEDWAVLPNVLQALKNIGFKITVPLAEKIVRKAGKNGRQNVVLECLRRTRDTGMSFHDINFTRTVLSWIQYKAIELDKDDESIAKTLSFAEQILDMLEDPKYTGNRPLHASNHPRNLPETIATPLCIAAHMATRFQEGIDKDKSVSKYATQFVTKTKALPLLPSIGKVPEMVEKLAELTQNAEKNTMNEEADEVSEMKKEITIARYNLLTINAKFVHWMFLHAQVIKGLKLALPVLGPDYEHRALLSERLTDLETCFSSVEAAWKQILNAQGKEATDFSNRRLLKNNSSEE